MSSFPGLDPCNPANADEIARLYSAYVHKGDRSPEAREANRVYHHARRRARKVIADARKAAQLAHTTHDVLGAPVVRHPGSPSGFVYAGAHGVPVPTDMLPEPPAANDPADAPV